MSGIDARGLASFRLFIGLAILALAIMAILMLMPQHASATGTGNYPPPATGDWIITTNTQVTNENFMLKGNVVVQPGKGLTLDRVTVTMNNSMLDPSVIEIQSTGAMTLRRSTIKVLDPESPSYMIVLNGGRLTMDNSTVQGLGQRNAMPLERAGLTIRSNDVTITNSVIKGGWMGLFLDNASPTVIGTNITGNIYGIYVRDTAIVNFLSDIFHNNVMGLYAERSFVSVQTCQFMKNSDFGIGALDSNVTISETDVTGSGRSGLWASGSLILVSNGTLDGMSNDVSLDLNSSLLGVNVTMDLSTISIEDMKSHVTVFDSLDIKVVWWSDNGPVDGAVVNITGHDGAEVANGTTGVDGYIRTLLVPAYDVDHYGRFVHRPINLTARANGLMGNASADIKGWGQVNITIDDIVPNLNVTLPGVKGYYNSSAVDVRGILWDNESGPAMVEVSVDGGNFTPADGIDIWNRSVVLADGKHNITVRGWDVAGNNRTLRLNITIDTKAPSVAIKGPKDGIRINKTRVWVNGTAEKGANITIGGKNVTNNNGTWGVFVNITEGSNNITVFAMDRAGNVGRAWVTVVRDTIVDPLSVTPVNGSWVNTKNLTIKGTTEPGAYLRVTWDMVTGTGNNTTVVHRNATAKADAKGAFNLTVQLTEGLNNFTLFARDSLNNTKSINLTYSLDDVPPLLVLTAPTTNPFYTNKNGVNIKGRTETGGRVFLNGQELQLYDLKFTIRVEVYLGINNFTLTALDTAGNLARLNLTIWVDKTPPNLTVARPAKAQENTKDAYYIVSGNTEEGATVTINGISYGVGMGGRFEAKRSLAIGRNELTITARDQAGNARSVNRVIIREKAPPDMTWIYVGYSLPFIALGIILGSILFYLWRTGKLRSFKDYMDRRKAAKEKEPAAKGEDTDEPPKGKDLPEEPVVIPGGSGGPSYDDTSLGDSIEEMEEPEAKEEA